MLVIADGAEITERFREMLDPKYYPLFVRLENRVCLVAGGGAVGERKIRTLLNYHARIRLLARDLTPWLQSQCTERAITFLGADYREAFLDGADLVFAASSDPRLNQRIASDSRKRGLWCNMATDPRLGSFVVPAMLERGPLSIAISTSGISPTISGRIRKALESQFGPEWGPFLVLLGSIRLAIQDHELGTLENQRLFRELAGLPLLDWIQTNQREPALQALHHVCQPWLTSNELTNLWDEACRQYCISSQPRAT
jgi:precorrin-2 dehydrogenase / sirohydrochlorin ferrochelatase